MTLASKKLNEPIKCPLQTTQSSKPKNIHVNVHTPYNETVFIYINMALSYI